MEKINKVKAQNYVPVRKQLKAAALCQKKITINSQSNAKNTLPTAA